MNNNKTVVPGMGNPFDSSNQQPQMSVPQSYSGTCVPGMGQNRATGEQETQKPIMGFLYSVSRTSCGEYWPLYLGLNTIGRGTNCSVRLSESTISENHAELVIRQMKNPDGILAFVKDAISTCGTMLNGSSLNLEPQECRSGDIITIGEHYELYVILIDAKALGLSKCEEFRPAEGALGGTPSGMPGGFGGFPQMPSMPQMPSPGGTALFGQQPQQPQQNGGGTVLMDALKR